MKDFETLIEELNQTARAAGAAEQQFHKEAAERAKQLSEERAFAYRRVNLLRLVATGMRSAETEEEALERGRRVMLREVGWNGATQAQKEVAERFTPVAAAIRASTAEEEPADASTVSDTFAEFEAWYADERNGAFLSLMEREVVELPLVEV